MDKYILKHVQILCKLDLLTTKGLRTEIKISRSASILSTAFLRIMSAFLRTCNKCRIIQSSYVIFLQQPTSVCEFWGPGGGAQKSHILIQIKLDIKYAFLFFSGFASDI